MAEKKNPYAVDEQTLFERYSGERPLYSGDYDEPMADLYEKISNRPDFQYDATADPLYQAAKDRYIQGGKLAMRDTMGQAAALTGGYGTSYGQQVGQQAYDAYLQKLGEVVPELYSAAYGRYQDENDKLLQQYAMLGQQRDTEYGRWRDELGDWERERSYQDQRESELYNRQYAEQQQAYARLYALIGSTGYRPTDEELAAAGMTRAAADALKNEYTRQITPAATSGGGSSGGGGRGGGYRSGADIAELQRQLNALGENLAVDGIYGPLTQAAAARHGLVPGAAGGSSGNGNTGGGGGTWGFQQVAGAVDNAIKNGWSSTDINNAIQQEVKAGTITQDEAQYIWKDRQVRDRL